MNDNLAVALFLSLMLVIVITGVFIAGWLFLQWLLPKAGKIFEKLKGEGFFDDMKESTASRISYVAAWTDYLAIQKDKKQFHHIVDRIKRFEDEIDFVNAVPDVKKMGQFKAIIPENPNGEIEFTFKFSEQ